MPSDVPSDAPPLDALRRARRQRGLWLAVVLLLLAGLAGLSGHVQRDLLATEGERLASQVHALQRKLAGDLGAVQAALLALRSEAALADQSGREAMLAAQMRLLERTVAGVSALHWLDADGRVRASSVAMPPGGPVHEGARVPVAGDARQAGTLHVSAPYAKGDGRRTLDLSLLLVGADGGVAGAVVAVLDAAHLRAELESVLYMEDMRAALVHGSGEMLMVAPLDAHPSGTSLARAGTAFDLHLRSGRASGVWQGVALGSGDERLFALHTLALDGLPMDTPLVLSLSRNVDAVLAPGKRQLAIGATLLAALVLASGLLMLALQRRRLDAEHGARERQAEQQAHAERLALALRGADLALSDTDLASGRSTVNERWFTIVGLQPGDLEPDHAAWLALMHPDDRVRVPAALQRHLDGGSEFFEASYRLRHRAGHWVWVLHRARAVRRDAAGAPLRIVGTHMDISERVQAEETLRRSEQSLAATLMSIGDGVIATDAEGLVTRMNPAAERLTGWSAAQAAGRPLAEVFQVDTTPAQDGDDIELPGAVRLRSRDGREHHVSEHSTPIRAVDGAIVGEVRVFGDIGAAYRAMRSLRHHEAQLATVADALPGPMTRQDHEGRYRFVNAAFGRWFGLPPEQVLGRTRLEVLGEGVAQNMAPLVARALAGETATGDHRTLTREGWRDVMVTVVPDRDGQGRVQGVFTVAVDITERKRMEDELRLSESRLRMAGRLARLGGWRFELPALQLWMSPEVAAMLAVDPQRPLAADEALDLVVEEDRDRWRRCVLEAMRGGPPFDAALRGRARDGRDLHLRVLGEAVRDALGRVVAVQGAMQDISAQVQAEQTLRAAQHELQATLAAVPDLLFDVDLQGRIHNQHSPRSELLLLPPAEFLGRRIDEIMPAEPAAVVDAALQQAHASGYSGGLQYELPLPLGRRWFELSVARKEAAPGQPPRFIALARDITERKLSEAEHVALERQLREAQKMESIGTLAGGIAHDFNNILAAILGNAALAREDLPTGHAALSSLDQIHKAGLRARSLVQQILTFSRRQPHELMVQDLRQAVEETLALLRATLPASVRLDSRLSPEPVPVAADATQLHQVLMNLCTNAWHALPDSRGRIEIGLCIAATEDLPAATRQGLPSGPCAHLWVRDDGIGMDDATRQRIFDPFFTTKAVGQGTGLGLSVVHGIVRGHHGAIDVVSAPGQGSTFHLLLPLAGDGDGARPRRGGDGAGAPAAAGRGIVYVDDDEVMVLLVQRLLQRAGHDVRTYVGAPQLLAALARGETLPDLVVTDFNMPEMSGIELALALRRRWPAVPVVISSGFLSDDLRRQADAAGVSALLKKENTLEELVDLVQRLLAPQAHS